MVRSDGGVENDINQFISDISLSFCRVLWHYGELQNSIGIKGYFSILSPCVSVREYRGSARRARGLERWHIVFCSITPSVTTCHFAYILHGKTQGEKGGLFTLWFGIFLCKRAIPLDFLLSRYSH